MVEWDFGEHPVSNEEIIEVENLLQVKFPKDYLEGQFDETRYDEELLEDENWYIHDENNSKRGIIVPAVHPDVVTLKGSHRSLLFTESQNFPMCMIRQFLQCYIQQPSCYKYSFY